MDFDNLTFDEKTQYLEDWIYQWISFSGSFADEEAGLLLEGGRLPRHHEQR
jgi:hypothetical protein